MSKKSIREINKQLKEMQKTCISDEKKYHKLNRELFLLEKYPNMLKKIGNCYYASDDENASYEKTAYTKVLGVDKKNSMYILEEFSNSKFYGEDRFTLEMYRSFDLFTSEKKKIKLAQYTYQKLQFIRKHLLVDCSLVVIGKEK